MEFLSNQSVLHRDIALRNMLLASGYIVKVADFGLSRKIENDLYQPSNTFALPIAYLAPEVIKDRQFSSKSESWAFGIVLWELFTLAEHLPYVKECGGMDACAISAFLGANKRLPIAEITPFSIWKLISQLWNENPVLRPEFKDCPAVIMKELKVANPQLAEQAVQMWNGHKNIERPILVKEVIVHKSSAYAVKVCNVFPLRYFVPMILLALLLTLTLIIAFALRGSDDHGRKGFVEDRKGFVAVRWSWTFNASDVYNKEQKINYGPKGILDLGSDSGCRPLKWQPFFDRPNEGNSSFKIPFALRYAGGPDKQRAWRSMLLTTGDGREIMIGNDFGRNGFVYESLHKYDEHVWAADSIHLTNSSANDPLTLKIEVFVKTNCKIKQATQYPVNYEEECKKLSTKAKVFFDGACYVGSNTYTQFDIAKQLCNDIPSAEISRLAWIESEDLVDKLKDTLVIRDYSGKLVNESYYIGAMQSSENDNIGTAPNGNWYWVDSNKNPVKQFPRNFTLWSDDEPVEDDGAPAALFLNEKKLRAVSAIEDYRYLCEYRKGDAR
uniref:Protein kinase domain-containing protein n=1 Tax=Plectus sambesii TaxID=2011161 RepID=A0A914X8I8_9BILA